MGVDRCRQRQDVLAGLKAKRYVAAAATIADTAAVAAASPMMLEQMGGVWQKGVGNLSRKHHRCWSW